MFRNCFNITNASSDLVVLFFSLRAVLRQEAVHVLNGALALADAWGPSAADRAAELRAVRDRVAHAWAGGVDSVPASLADVYGQLQPTERSDATLRTVADPLRRSNSKKRFFFKIS